jgi:hypothetical protein
MKNKPNRTSDQHVSKHTQKSGKASQTNSQNNGKDTWQQNSKDGEKGKLTICLAWMGEGSIAFIKCLDSFSCTADGRTHVLRRGCIDKKTETKMR